MTDTRVTDETYTGLLLHNETNVVFFYIYFLLLLRNASHVHRAPCRHAETHAMIIASAHLSPDGHVTLLVSVSALWAGPLPSPRRDVIRAAPFSSSSEQRTNTHTHCVSVNRAACGFLMLW